MTDVYNSLKQEFGSKGDAFAESFADVFDDAYETDGEATSKKFGKILSQYFDDDTDGKVKAAISEIFLNLCGWSMTTLLRKAANNLHGNEIYSEDDMKG
jgi:hypothetical protein